MSKNFFCSSIPEAVVYSPVSAANAQTATQPESDFLRLPRELRDRIYGYYFRLEGGYTYNPATNKLHPTGPQKNPLSLTLANKEINQQTQGLALEHNTIYFTTSFNLDTSDTLGMFNYLLDYISRTQSKLLIYLIAESDWVACQAHAYAEKHYPQFLPIVNEARNGKGGLASNKYWRETPSIARAFVERTLHFVLRHEDFFKLPIRDLEAPPEIYAVANVQYEAWRVPTKNEVENLAFRTFTAQPAGAPSVLVPADRVPADIETAALEFWNGERYRSSAASLAIRFMQSLETKLRVKMRKVVLDEDRVSVGWPACHAQGLIPICQENPRIRIERRVSLWGNAFRAGCIPLISLMRFDHLPHRARNPRVEYLQAWGISHNCFAPWIKEVYALSTLGMPQGCFKLLFDGDPIPERTSQLFKIALMDAAGQLAYEHMSRTAVPAERPFFETRTNVCFVMDGYPQALQDITNGTSIVECNFDTGSMPDWNVIYQTNAHLSNDEWAVKWRNDHLDMKCETESPLPSWLDLRREDHLSQRVTFNTQERKWETRTGHQRTPSVSESAQTGSQP